DNIILPPGVSLNKIQPAVLDVTLDTPAMKELPVQADWTGRLPDNLMLLEVSISPETVKVVGGSKTLEKVATVYTTPLRLDNITRSGSISTSVVLSPPSLRMSPLSPEKVIVHYQIGERTHSEKK
ncbi:MAG: YbbR-like domain-containing protein, partial [Syntrophobacteraceae bacterium]